MLKCQIVGNIGSDPEMRYSASGAPYLRFNVASNGRTRDAGGEWKDETTWVRVTVFGQRADALHQHLSRGTRVYVDGRLEARPWIDRSNEPRAGLELMADTVEFVSSRRSPDFDISDLPAASVADERRDRHPAMAGARGAAAYATGTDEKDLGDLPF